MTKLKQQFLSKGCNWNVHIAFEKDGKKGGVNLMCSSDAQLDTLLLALLPIKEGKNRDLALKEIGSLIGNINLYDPNQRSGVPTTLEDILAKIPEGATITGITKEGQTIDDILLGSPFFSTQENTLDLVNHLIEKTDKLKGAKTMSATPDDEISVTEELTGSLGYTKFAKSLGNKNDWTSSFVTPFDPAEYVDTSTKNMMEREKSLPENLRRTEEDIRACYQHEADTWGILTDTGSAIHNVFEAVMKGEQIPADVGNFLNEQQLKKAEQEAKNLKASIQKQYPGCTILTEVKIISRELDPDLLKAMHTKYPDKNNIDGRIDLLVIDKNNNAHIYDYKVSRKSIGAWDIQENGILADNFYWTSEKKRDVTMQLAVYAQILKQYGIRVQDCNILPIKITPKYDDSGLVLGEFDKSPSGSKAGHTVVGLQSIDVHYDANSQLEDGKNVYKVPKTLEGDIYRNVARMIPSDLDIKGLDIKNSYEQFKSIFPTSKVGDQISIAKNDKRDVD